MDPASVVIWAMATCTVIAGSQLAVEKDRAGMSGDLSHEAAGADDDDFSLPVQDLTMVHALGFVFMASGMLVLLFFFIRTIITFLVVFYCLASVSAITAVFAPLLAKLAPSVDRRVKLPLLDYVSVAHLVCGLAGLCCACVWFPLRFSGLVWPLQDLMSVSLCLQILNTVRFTDIKGCASSAPPPLLLPLPRLPPPRPAPSVPRPPHLLGRLACVEYPRLTLACSLPPPPCAPSPHTSLCRREGQCARCCSPWRSFTTSSGSSSPPSSSLKT